MKHTKKWMLATILAAGNLPHFLLPIIKLKKERIRNRKKTVERVRLFEKFTYL